LTFDATGADPQVKYEIVNINGETVHELTIKRSELQLPNR
jgi:hypothetical protein